MYIFKCSLLLAFSLLIVSWCYFFVKGFIDRFNMFDKPKGYYYCKVRLGIYELQISKLEKENDILKREVANHENTIEYLTEKLINK